MYKTQVVVCQYLAGSAGGAKCSLVDKLIRTMKDADIHFCMGRHYEACALYISSLQKAAISLISPCKALEPDM